MKSLERVRSIETDPKACMKMLQIYEEIGKILGPEEVGMKILPGIIPMLISGQFTKSEFSDLMSSVRRLLDQIEKHRMPTLPDTGSNMPLSSSSGPEPTNNLFAGVGGSKPTQSNDADVFEFLGGAGGGGSSDPFASKPSADPFASKPDPFAPKP